MIIIEEIWKNIEGYEGYYQVSNLGRVKSLERIVYNTTKELKRTRKAKIKALVDKSDGYYYVSLSKNGVTKLKSVHRLVAIAFIDNPLNKEQVNHKDCNKHNNCIDNLEWVTPKENTRHAYEHGLMQKGLERATQAALEHKSYLKASQCALKVNCKPVIAIRLSDGKQFQFSSITEAGNQLHISPNNISALLRGKYKYDKIKGYTFRYANNNK